MKIAILLIAVFFIPLSPVDPSWDPALCRNPAFASAHRDLCGNPLLNTGPGNGSECGGLCGVVRGVLGHLGLG